MPFSSTPATAAKEIEVANVALANIGVGPPISAGSASDRNYVACNRVYSNLRDRLLQSYDWAFAKVQAVLAENKGYPAGLLGFGKAWSYAYTYPSDSVRLIRLVDPNDFERRPRFTVLHHSSGKTVLCHEAPAENLTPLAEYVTQIEDPTQFDEAFSQALSWLISANIALQLSGKPEFMEAAMNMHRTVLVDAGLISTSEQHDLPMNTGDSRTTPELPGKQGFVQRGG